MIDYYSLLGVPFNATKQQIKDAYRRKVKTSHPDAGGTEKEFIILQNAFQTLQDEYKRKIYDEEYISYFEDLLSHTRTTSSSDSTYQSNSDNESRDGHFKETADASSSNKKTIPIKKGVFYFSLVLLMLGASYFLFLEDLLTEPVRERYSMLFETAESIQGDHSNLTEHELEALEESREKILNVVLPYRVIAGFFILMAFVLLIKNRLSFKGKLSMGVTFLISSITSITLLLAALNIYEDYFVLKWVCFIGALFLLYKLIRNRPSSEIIFGLYTIIYGSMIVLFNPIVIIHMEKNTWTFIDLFIMLFIILQPFLTNEHTHSSFTNQNDSHKM